MSVKILVLTLLVSSVLFISCDKVCECPKPETDSCLLPSLNGGLVAYFPFNNNATDESGFGNSVIFNNATLTTDRYNKPNKAYQFDGATSYMRIANSPSLNPLKISLCVLVKPTGFNRASLHGSSILYKGFRDQDIFNVYFMRFSDGPESSNADPNNPNIDTMHQVFYSSFAGNSPPLKPPYVHTNKWYSLVYTYDGALANVYIDGNLVSSVMNANIYTPGSLDLFLGRTDNPLFPYWFNGVIDELRIYNRALTSAEVKSFGSSCNIN